MDTILSHLKLIIFLLIFGRDRPWQAWPITILTGAYLGYVAGSLIGRTPLVYGRIVEFDFSTEDEKEKEKEKEKDEKKKR
jgi:hypothetical protein